MNGGLAQYIYQHGYITEYDCKRSPLTSEEWYASGSVNYSLGIPYCIYGITSEIVYMLVLRIIMRKEYRKYSCYKIMLVLGAYDMLAIFVNSILTGYFYIIGARFCTHPRLIFIFGSIGLGLWCGACMNCLVLVTNRLMDLWNPAIMYTFFDGHRCYAILMLPLVYSLYFTLFTRPLLYNSHVTAWFFDPFIMANESQMFYNIPHTVNNLAIVVATCILYVLLCYILAHKYQQEGISKITWTQKSIMLQSTAICVANLIAALVYVYMQFLPTPHWVTLIGHISWQIGHGIPAYVYLILNKTIQREVLINLGFKSIKYKRNVLPSTSASTFHI